MWESSVWENFSQRDLLSDHRVKCLSSTKVIYSLGRSWWSPCHVFCTFVCLQIEIQNANEVINLGWSWRTYGEKRLQACGAQSHIDLDFGLKNKTKNNHILLSCSFTTLYLLAAAAAAYTRADIFECGGTTVHCSGVHIIVSCSQPCTVCIF